MDGGRKYTLSSLIDEGTLFMVIVLTQQETTLGYRDGGTSYTGANYHVKLPSIIAVCNTGAVQTIKFGYYSTLSMTSTGACTLSTGLLRMLGLEKLGAGRLISDPAELL